MIYGDSLSSLFFGELALRGDFPLQSSTWQGGGGFPCSVEHMAGAREGHVRVMMSTGSSRAPQ